MLLVPWAVGCAVGGGLTTRSVPAAVGWLALFLAQHRLADWLRHHRSTTWPDRGATLASLAFLAAIGAGALGFALAAQPLRASALLAAAAAIAALASLLLVQHRLDHALPGQSLAAVGLALAAPTGYLASGGPRGRVAVALWGITAAFFLWGVLYVNLQLVARARRRPLPRLADRVGLAAPTLGADLALALAVVLAVRDGGFSTLALAAFAPAALQSLAAIASLDRPPPLKRIGVTLLVHSLAFALLFSVLA